MEQTEKSLENGEMIPCATKLSNPKQSETRLGEFRENQKNMAETVIEKMTGKRKCRIGDRSSAARD